MDTEPPFFALVEKRLEDCIQLERKAEWEQLNSKNCIDRFTADAVGNIVPRTLQWQAQKNVSSGYLVFPKRSSGVQKCCVFVVKNAAATKLPVTTSNKKIFSSKGLNYQALRKSASNFLTREWRLHLQTEASEQRITQLQLMKKLNADHRVFIRKEW